MTAAAPPQAGAVVFDLDGTLVQTRAASWEVFRGVSARFGLGVDEPAQFFEMFRGNVFASIRELCRDDAEAAEVKAVFLDALRSDYSPPLVPGMPDVVRRLASRCTLAVLSSNAVEVVRRVLVDNQLAFCFAHVFGGDVAPDKQDALRGMLADTGIAFGRRCSADYDETGRQVLAGPAETVLVTDTVGDVREALAAGVRAVGVAWGMHGVDELTAAGAEFVALWPQELLAHLLGGAAAEPATGACALPARAPGAGAEPGRDCGCGCSGPAVVPRRERRRAAAAAAREPVPGPVPVSAGPSDDLLEAVRLVCRG